jgi:mycothiol synthase
VGPPCAALPAGRRRPNEAVYDRAVDDVTATAFPNSPRLEGYLFRHARLPDDLVPMNQVANAARFAEGDEWVTSDAQFTAFYQNLSNSDPATDLVIAERDGILVGYGRAEWYEALDGERMYAMAVLVHPDHARSLIEPMTLTVEARCREIAATHPAGPKQLETDASDAATVRREVLERLGFRPVRYSYLMIRPNLDELPDAELPAGLEVRPVTPDQLRTIFDAEVEAFRDHWGASVPTEADFRQFATDPVQGVHEMWKVAWDGDEVAGMVRGYINVAENEMYRRKRGWVENISVRRPWRRRGLARALIGMTISELRERGMSEGALGVDTENPTGALGLYEACGFKAVKREATYRKPLTPAS